MGGVLGKSIKNLFFGGCANEDGEGEDSDGAMDRLREEEGEREGSETAAVAVAIHSGDAGGRNGNLDLDLNLIMEADARAKAKANANPSDDVAIELGDIKASAVCKRKIQDSIVDTGRHLDDHKTQYSENTNYKYTTSTTISMQKGSENRLAEPASMASGFGSGAARAGSRSRAASGASDVLVVPFETKASVSLPLRITIGLVAVKMVLLPLVLMPFVYLVSDLLLDSNNENYSLTQLIAFLQCSLPSANLVLVVAQQMRRYQSTERMSQLYVIQYLVCMVTITASTTIALALAY